MPLELPPETASYSDRSPPPKKRQLFYVLSFFVGLVMAIFWSVSVMVNVLIGFIPPAVEQQLGALILPVYQQQAKASATQTALNQLLDRLEAHLLLEQKRDYQVLYIPQPVVNALAIPGDRIILYEGLLVQMESENELAMVLSHELGHFAHRDHLRQLGQGVLLQVVVAGVLGDLGGLQAIALSAATALNDAHFSQSQEYNADEFGLSLLLQTYGQVAGATDFFAQLSQGEMINVDFLATHPGSEKRVQRLEKLIQDKQYPVGERSPLPAALNVVNLERAN
ncbi:M48 family metallopeptidase [Phormidium tenue FACHB-886]|nr:M48 family metallopeptidase [Phormidium tenue FACHB-886]